MDFIYYNYCCISGFAQGTEEVTNSAELRISATCSCRFAYLAGCAPVLSSPAWLPQSTLNLHSFRLGLTLPGPTWDLLSPQHQHQRQLRIGTLISENNHDHLRGLLVPSIIIHLFNVHFIFCDILIGWSKPPMTVLYSSPCFHDEP